MTNPEQVGTDPQWTVGDRLRKGRELTGLDRGAFARTIGISRNSVTKYESGDSLPPKIVLNAWILATPVKRLWIETGNMELAGQRPDPDGQSAMTDWRNRSALHAHPSSRLTVLSDRIRHGEQEIAA